MTKCKYILMNKVFFLVGRHVDGRESKSKFAWCVRNHARPNSFQHIEPHLFISKGVGGKLLWISLLLLLLLLKLALQCQPWLVLAHGHFHALYLDPPGTVWNREISLSTKHVILSSVELRLASGQRRLKSRPWKQRKTVNILTLLLNTLCSCVLLWKFLL